MTNPESQTRSEEMQAKAEHLARECGKALAMDSAHIPLIANEILKSIPLAALLTAEAELSQLRSNIGILYEWIQGNTSLTGKQKEAANCIFDQLDKGVKEDNKLREELATAKAELEKWKLGCETNSDCYKTAVREQDNQRLELLKVKAENAALMDVAKALRRVRTLCVIRSEPYIPHYVRSEIEKIMDDALHTLAEKGVAL